MKHSIHTPQELAEKLDYNPDTGELTWKKLRDSTRIGQKAKALDVAGYIQVNISGNVYKGHRVAWAIHYGRWPVGMIDHINGQRSDNRIENLRECDHQTNCQNMRNGSCKNSTGFLGVYIEHAYPEGHPKRYRAKIQINRKQIHLGGHATPQLAHEAYVQAKRKIHRGCAI
jgi:hypothetical protein